MWIWSVSSLESSKGWDKHNLQLEVSLVLFPRSSLHSTYRWLEKSSNHRNWNLRSSKPEQWCLSHKTSTGRLAVSISQTETEVEFQHHNESAYLCLHIKRTGHFKCHNDNKDIYLQNAHDLFVEARDELSHASALLQNRAESCIESAEEHWVGLMTSWTSPNSCNTHLCTCYWTYEWL